MEGTLYNYLVRLTHSIFSGASTELVTTLSPGQGILDFSACVLFYLFLDERPHRPLPLSDAALGYQGEPKI